MKDRIKTDQYCHRARLVADGQRSTSDKRIRAFDVLVVARGSDACAFRIFVASRYRLTLSRAALSATSNARAASLNRVGSACFRSAPGDNPSLLRKSANTRLLA